MENSENILKRLPILVPRGEGYEIPNGLIGAKRDININLMSKLKNENDIRQFAGISGEYCNWKNHYLFRILKNAGPNFLKHPISEGFLLSKEKYLIETVGPTVLVFHQLMDRNTGTYQISFKYIHSLKLKDIEVGVLPITTDIYGDFSKKYRINFAGYPLQFKKLFELDEYYMTKKQKQTYQYRDYK
jgi:hypothetical protein